MLDFNQATKILTEHFANLTPEQFEINLREYCPELFIETEDTLERNNLKNVNPNYSKTPTDSGLSPQTEH